MMAGATGKCPMLASAAVFVLTCVAPFRFLRCAVHSEPFNDIPGRGKENYRTEKRLGGGSFGEVFRVRDTDTNRVFAMKIVQKQLGASAQVRQAAKKAFLNESAILRMLTQSNHPHILRHCHSFEDPKAYHIVTELCHGVSLFDRITACGTCKGGAYPFTERAAARITTHMIRAIMFCHSQGVVHRDIKPENFLFSTTAAQSPLKLIDFGEAVSLQNDSDRLYNVAGSEYYLAPEVLPTETESFRRTLGEWKAADLWSVGVVLYVCLFGRPPFVGSDPLSTFRKIKRCEYKVPRVSYLSENAVSFIKGLITKVPVDGKKGAKRLTAEEALRHPFLTSDNAKDDPIPASVLRSLTKFKKHCKLKRAVGRVLANKMKDEDKNMLKSVFREFDKNGDGKLDRAELTDLMRSVQDLDSTAITNFKRKKYVYGQTEAEELITASAKAGIDKDRRGSDDISEEDFISMYAAHHVGKSGSKKMLRKAFNALDTNGDGLVTAEDLHTSCGFMTPKTANAIAHESSSDAKGISFKAFMKAMANTPKLSGPPSPLLRFRSLRSGVSGLHLPMGSPVSGSSSDAKGTPGTGFASVGRALNKYQAPRIGNSTGSQNSGSTPSNSLEPPRLRSPRPGPTPERRRQPNGSGGGGGIGDVADPYRLPLLADADPDAGEGSDQRALGEIDES